MEKQAEQKTEQVYVEIVREADGVVVKRMGPQSRAWAERIEGGANINLNHDAYFTRIVPE